MPAQVIYSVYFLVSLIVFPFTAFNFVILNSSIFSDLNPFIITTKSMEPVIPAGSLIYTVRGDNYNIGDIVTFDAGHGNIAHRIEKLVKLGNLTYFSTKGDANYLNDVELVPESFIRGKIIAIIPLAGGIAGFFKTPIGITVGILMTVLPFVVNLRYKKIPA